MELVHSSIAYTSPPLSDTPFKAAPVHNIMLNGSGAINVFFLYSPVAKEHHMSLNYNSHILYSIFPPTPPNSKTSFFTDEDMPSLTPSCTYVLPRPKTPLNKPQLASTKCDDIKEDIPMLNPSKSFDEIFGTLLYLGLSCADGKINITFKGLTHSQAQHYILTSPLAQYNDYHSVYIPNVIYAIESFCFCQDQIISLDWNEHLFCDGSYLGHPVIQRHVKLPTGGPCSQQTWQEHVLKLCDHRAYTHHLINLLNTILSTLYAERYDNVNPSFTKSEAKYLNSYATVAEAHGEGEFVSKILNALQMPFLDEDTVHALMETQLLNVGTHTGLVIVATFSFQSNMFEDPLMSDEWYVLPNIIIKDEEIPESKPKKESSFFSILEVNFNF
ncbi:hypothetical protein CY34DRAFT_19020 [Suillus luteus UH-Slu-Lm8-n1]|uniref:Uncharacterized protein n=1 Tax=Suillus luteus UH-Slu-Lm8-n1 TaxID=930992 RepID=A0A0D0A2U8_9AGAM|nr:hypothetical protein CY34DRAFT_19020 [Suillus luteus UH-Slu-Lm8-n1]